MSDKVKVNHNHTIERSASKGDANKGGAINRKPRAYGVGNSAASSNRGKQG